MSYFSQKQRKISCGNDPNLHMASSHTINNNTMILNTTDTEMGPLLDSHYDSEVSPSIGILPQGELEELTSNDVSVVLTAEEYTSYEDEFSLNSGVSLLKLFNLLISFAAIAYAILSVDTITLLPFEN